MWQRRVRAGAASDCRAVSRGGGRGLARGRRPRRRDLSLRHQDLREGSAREALLFDDVQLQALVQVGEWAAARADRNRDRRELVFVDKAESGQRLGEAGAAVDEDRSFVVPSLQVRDLRAEVPAEDLDWSPFRLLQGVREDGLRLLV